MLDILQSFAIPIVVIGLVVAAASAFLVFARNYRKCPPNKVLVIYGKRSGDKGYRLITGGAAFVMPLFEGFTEIGLENFSVEASVIKTPNNDGVPVNVEAVANVKVSSNPSLLALAVERMLGKPPEEIRMMLKVTLDGLLRQIIGTLTVEDMVKDREKLAQGVLSNAQTELQKLGFDIDNFVINKLGDDEGYIDAMGAKRTAEVKRDAEIAQAEAKREALMKSSAAKQEGETARLAAEQKIAESERDLSLKRAGFKKETETAQADADMARALKNAEVDRELRQRKVAAEEAETKARIALAEQEAQRKEQELVATVIRPAEAQAKALTITAEGNSSAATKQAEATKAEADAKKVKLTLEGEGQAAAEAARHRQLGLAEAAATEARGRAEAISVEAKGRAEGAAIQARLLAEAEGLQKKNEALASMSDAARLIIVLERLPQIIEEVGEAGQKVVGSAFEHIGAGMSRIDSVHIVDLGGNNGNGSDPLSKFALNIPKTVFGTLAQAQAMGIDLESLLEKLGVPRETFSNLVGQLNGGTKAIATLNNGEDSPQG